MRGGIDENVNCVGSYLFGSAAIGNSDETLDAVSKRGEPGNPGFAPGGSRIEGHVETVAVQIFQQRLEELRDGVLAQFR